ncbi:regulatory protein, luxR family [Hyunsoonleella jejuensis]|uniref:Regulatory protein, luxR family n=1 Tax=Hyunsoonleella jejuensis TaxID=419940 RepID=A0A1H9B4Z8_9FLAO|nr:triple tyrosine motif-containing protein [Hyunsoonleella jejuensis]SEP84120.1 regulatory protein, luxR family [Hyunsoonleella jejuensis]
MKRISYCILFVISGLFLKIAGQESPPINVFYPSDYQGESQNWSISQSQNRFIYVANNKGLLEYNGAIWNLYRSPNETIIRAVTVIDDLIYTGSYHDFGYWKKNRFGRLQYTSLAKELQIKFLEDEEFWKILTLGDVIIFQSLDRIHIYNKETKSYTYIDQKSKITGVFKVNTDIYFQTINNGLFVIKNGNAVLVSNDSILKNNLIVNIYNRNNALYILTQDKGFLKLENNRLSSWDIPANTMLQDVSAFSSIQLKDKSYVIGTIGDGIIHISINGEIKYQINQKEGLTNNTVLSVFEDLDNNIWLGLDNGINCINSNSPFKFYFDKTGVIGSVYASKVFDEMLYLGTNQGLFYKPLKSDEDFKFIEGTQGQVWFLNIIENTLFCGHNSGTFIINKSTASKIANVQGTWQIKKLPNKPNELIQGNYDGLYILNKSNGEWRLKHKVKGFNISSRYFEFADTNEIYLSHEYKGVFKLTLSEDLTEVLTYSKDTLLKKGLNSSLIRYNDNLLYAHKNGVFSYNRARKAFEKDSTLSKLINIEHFTSAKIIADSKTNKIWSFSSRGIHYLAPSKLSGEQKIFTVPFPEDIREDVRGYESVTPIEEQQFLLGSTTGYVILDLDKIKSHDHKIDINRVTVNTSKGGSDITFMDLSTKPELRNKENNLRIRYSISEFSKTERPEYSYKLEGIYDEWSDWSTRGSVLFENLPYGDYNFVVKGRVGNQITSNNATYAFRIKRPLLLSNLAIGLYVLVVLLFSLLMHNIYKRYYRKQRERLIKKSTREFELKELENKQQLMRFKNEKLREDIENKNRELGISTMSLIKKNEFLSSLKQELESIKDTKALGKVIKIIDRNLNNNDDWNLFQEAFNNADKDFLKKIKELHPSLTSNDLRLCAYLRLNLTSKEIAPLLNISSRSVEVKRYRLRKKMDLPHEASLSDYILEI